jgi:xylulose-5-phosphate/fructose-6-phosphate phosphoketolase
VLSEHLCQGWLEGYLLTGRHGVFTSYEAFIRIVDSMLDQHAKWLKVSRQLEWRRPLASLNYLLSSHVWRQDHNGFSHQDPGFIDHVVDKKAEVVRVYLPPDANTLLATMRHCLDSRHYVNVVVAGKQPAHDYLSTDDVWAGGAGPAPTTKVNPTWCSPAPATSRLWRPWPQQTCCAARCPTWPCGSSTSWT